ncbi:MAG TPA: glycosyltransferase family 4 protein [Ilumatobacteraceae bacterium]|nr:glycosyltransferase family 4 protein [Ilumatobacteraceae bacterium]
MRILVVNSFFPPRTTGSAHFSLDVAREYVRQGHDVWVMTTSVPGAAEREVMDGITVVRVPAWSVTPGSLAFNYALPFVVRLGVIRRVKRLFDEVRPEVVHQNGQFFDLTFVTTWVAWRRGIPRVLTVHTPLMHTNAVLRAFISTVDRTALRLLNAPGRPVVVGVDRYVCEMAQRRYRPRRGPVRFIPATLRVDEFGTGDGDRVRRRLGLGLDRPVILSFGHVIPIRSRVPLIQALPRIAKRFPDVRVLVVGEVYYDEFQRLAEELGVADHVVVTGRVPHVEVPDYLAAATVESHDLDGHGLGITTLEVMAARVPIFARVRRDVFPGIDLDQWPELQIVESAEPTAIADSICHLLESPQFRKHVADRQFEFVNRYFRADVVARQYLDLFEELRR